MIGLTSKWRPFLGAYMVFGILCAVAAMFTYGALAQEKPELQRMSTKEVKLLQQSAQAALRSDELSAIMAHARSVLELIARDPEVAETILRAASANRAERSAGLNEANHLIKKKSRPARVKATQEVKISDVYLEGKKLHIEISSKTKKEGNGPIIVIVIVINTH